MGLVHASKQILAFGLAILLVAALAFTAQPARAAMDRPTWASGDFWAYYFSSDLFGTTIRGTLRFDVTGTESVDVNGTAYPTYRVAAVIMIPTGGISYRQPADLWFSTNTLAIVKIRTTFNCICGDFSPNTTISIAGSPPQNVTWPLTPGSTWSSGTTVWTTTTNSTGLTTYASAPLMTDFFVQADTTISVPGNWCTPTVCTTTRTFTVTPLRETDRATGNYSINFWASEVGNWARVEDYDNGGAKRGGVNPAADHHVGGGFFTSGVFGLLVWVRVALLVLSPVGRGWVFVV